ESVAKGGRGGGLPELAVLAPAPVISAESTFFLVELRLAFHTQADTRHRLATSRGDGLAAFFAGFAALATRQARASTINRILYICVDLVLYRTVFCKSASHRAVTPRVHAAK